MFFIVRDKTSSRVHGHILAIDRKHYFFIYIIYDVLENELENAYHEHNYNSYSYINGSQHRASCSCGDSYLEYHSVRSNSRMCMYCRGIVDKGIIDIPFRLLDRSIEGYYVHESGVKVYE